MVRSLLGEKRGVAAVCVSSSFCVTCSCFLSHFVSRNHFKSEVSCGSPMASASWALLPGGELCSTLMHDSCLRCDGSVSREAAMVYPCTRFFVLVPALPDAPPEPEMIDMPPASARPMSNLERCIALRLVATRRSHRPTKIALASYHIVPLLSPVSVVPCVVSLFCRVRWCPAQAPRQ